MLLAAFLVVFSVVHFLFVVSLLRDPARLRAYVETSPKAFLWRKILGVERTVELTRRVFLPGGFVIAVGMFLAGVSLLAQSV
ncbi:MAG: hypothetical protein FJ102_16450, partial [Deltaproteobacteria bacterium]|nr:hypothetical protein [Deltaproteobacteria bacterium]